MNDDAHPSDLHETRGAAVRIMEKFLVGPSGVTSASRGDDVQPSEIGTSSTVFDHDLDDRIPGLRDLRAMTTGASDVTIVILDGTPDLSVTSLASDRISRVSPYWNARATPITPAEYARFREIFESEEPEDTPDQHLLAAFPRSTVFRIMGDRHATHITAVIAGQPGTAAPGIAPGCRVIVVPLNDGGSPEEYLSTLNLARGFEFAQSLGADIIHCAACYPTQTDAPPELLERAVQSCLDEDILVVSPVGNNFGDCRCIPAILPGTLGVGALKEDGIPFKFSNWGGHHAQNGIMALGTEILGAQPGTDEPIREKGTSVAAPVVTAICALLMSLQSLHRRAKSGAAVRAAILDTATPCKGAPDDALDRCMHGVLNVAGATAQIMGQRAVATPAAATPAAAEAPVVVPSVVPDASATNTPNVTASDAAQTVPSGAGAPDMSLAVAPQSSGQVTQSTAHSGIVFGIGALALGFETTAKRDDFQSAMVRSANAGGRHGRSAGDIEAVLDFLDQNPVERRSVIWLLEHDDAPIYALKPVGAYADVIYKTLLNFLAGQNSDCAFGPHVERVSIPGRRTGKTQTLSSGDTVAEVGVADARGIFGWNIESLAQDAAHSVLAETGVAEDVVARLQTALSQLLRRIYFDLHNLGQTSCDRAMNFSATNCFQVATVLAEVLQDGYAFETLVVTKSPLGRLRSDCWELSLTFIDPDNDNRAVRVFQFTVDVSDVQPVTVGNNRSWRFRRDV